MVHAALLTFLCAKAPDDESRQGSNVALLEAGTGTGMTVAYCLAAIVASELLERTVVVSTATVALQERLFHKDLPRLAKIITECTDKLALLESGASRAQWVRADKPVHRFAEGALGLQVASAFHRAFRKWTGVQPGAYRDRATGGVDDGRRPDDG